MAVSSNALAGQSGLAAFGHNVGGCDCSPHPERVAQWHFTTHFHSPSLTPYIANSEASLFIGCVNSTYEYRPFRFAVAKIADSVRFVLCPNYVNSMCATESLTAVNKLLIPQFRCLIPTPRVPYGVGRICMEVCTATCTCSFRAVNAGALLSELQWARSPYTQHIPPTHRSINRLHYQPSATFYYTSAMPLSNALRAERIYSFGRIG